MQFLKKNYEKIVLGVVVLATLGVVAFLPIMVSQEKQKLDDLENKASPPPKPLAELDLTPYDKFVQRAKTTVSLDLADPHKIFNPVRYQMKAGNVVFRNPAGTDINNLEVTKITPLPEIYSFTGASASTGLATHYGIGIKHEAAAGVQQRNVKITYAEMNKTTNNFTVIAAEGPEEDPTSVKLRLTDSGAVVTITKDKPFQRTEGYTADLMYTPEKKPYPQSAQDGFLVHLFRG